MSDHTSQGHDDLPKFISDGEAPKYAHFRVRGIDPARFAKLFGLLVDKFEALLACPSPGGGNATLGDEFKELTAGALDYAKAKLAAPGADVERVRAEATAKFAEAKRQMSEARKADAESSVIEQAARKAKFDEDMRQMLMLLRMMKVMVIPGGPEDPETVIVGAQIEQLMTLLKEFADDARSLPPAH